MKEEVIVLDTDRIIQAVKDAAKDHDLCKLGYVVADAEVFYDKATREISARVYFMTKSQKLLDSSLQEEEDDPVDKLLGSKSLDVLPLDIK